MSLLSPPQPRQARTPAKARPIFQSLFLSAEVEVPAALETIVAALRKSRFSDKDIFAVRLALEEGLVNGLLHGNGGDPTKHVELRFSLDAQQVILEIEDEGAGFDPNQVADPLALENIDKPSGRGLLLMRAYSDWLQHNARGNCVSFARWRS